MTTRPDTLPSGPGTTVALERMVWQAGYRVVFGALGCAMGAGFAVVVVYGAAVSGRLLEGPDAPLGLFAIGGVLLFLLLSFSAILVAGVRAARARPVLWVGVENVVLHDRRVLAHDLVLPRSSIEHVRVIDDESWMNRPGRDEFTCSPFDEIWTIRVRLNEWAPATPTVACSATGLGRRTASESASSGGRSLFLRPGCGTTDSSATPSTRARRCVP